MMTMRRLGRDPRICPVSMSSTSVLSNGSCPRPNLPHLLKSNLKTSCTLDATLLLLNTHELISDPVPFELLCRELCRISRKLSQYYLRFLSPRHRVELFCYPSAQCCAIRTMLTVSSTFSEASFQPLFSGPGRDQQQFCTLIFQ